MVTGAASGIGLATAKGFAELGACVYALDVNRCGLKKLAEEVNSVYTIFADLCKPEEWRRKLEELELTQIDVLCNVAAIIDPGKPPNGEPPNIEDAMEKQRTICGLTELREDLQKVFDINYAAPYFLSLFAAEKMKDDVDPKKKNRCGVIINVGSTNVFTLKEQRLAYVPMKAALHTLTLLMAKTLAQYGIRVNGVLPGATENTGMSKDKKLLFIMESGYQNDLENGIVSGDLRQRFENNKTPLSQNVTISIEEPGSNWLVIDGNRTYIVKKEEDKLNIYDKGGKGMPLGINTPEDVAKAIIFLASDNARNVTGQLLRVDGGRCVAM